jgi:phosphonate transport system substrate-binding protein
MNLIKMTSIQARNQDFIINKTAQKIRIISVLGPSPIPPLVVLRSVPLKIRELIREILLQMHKNEHGNAILTEGLVRKFVAVEDQDYDVIREMAKEAVNAKM